MLQSTLKDPQAELMGPLAGWLLEMADSWPSLRPLKKRTREQLAFGLQNFSNVHTGLERPPQSQDFQLTALNVSMRVAAQFAALREIGDRSARYQKSTNCLL